VDISICSFRLNSNLSAWLILMAHASWLVLLARSGQFPRWTTDLFFKRKKKKKKENYCSVLVASRQSENKNSRVLKKLLLALLVFLLLLPSPWVLLQLLQALSQYCDVRCFSMAPTIVIGFLACVCTCVDFDFGIFSQVSCPAHHLLQRLLSL
jgi:hypothetical protein